MIEGIGEFDKVDVGHIQTSVTFGEIDAIELMTGMGLTELQTKRQGLLTRACIVIGLRRQGKDVNLKQLEHENPNDYVSVEESEPVEDPTEASG